MSKAEKQILQNQLAIMDCLAVLLVGNYPAGRDAARELLDKQKKITREIIR